MPIGSILVLVGIALGGVGAAFFRQPGVPFLFFGLIWRANQYLTPTGVWLWIVGAVAIIVGLLVRHAAHA